METLPGLPCRITLFVFACHPSAAGGVEQVLCTEDVHAEEELRVLDGTVYMALCGKVDDIVNVVLSKELVSKLAVADVSLYKEATLVVNVILNGTEVAA